LTRLLAASGLVTMVAFAASTGSPADARPEAHAALPGASMGEPYQFFGLQCDQDPANGSDVFIESGTALYDAITNRDVTPVCRRWMTHPNIRRVLSTACTPDRAEAEEWNQRLTTQSEWCGTIYYCWDVREAFANLESNGATHVGIGYWPGGYFPGDGWPQRMCIDNLEPS
jgi:hypothetical protein